MIKIGILIYILNVALFLSLLWAIILIANHMKNSHIDTLVSERLTKFNNNYEKRVQKLRYRQYYQITAKKINYIQNLDILIEKSNLRTKIKFITAEVILLFSACLAILSFTLVFYILFNIFAAITVAIFSFLLPRLLLNILAHKNAGKVDDMLVFYINILTNFCYVNDNIIFAIERSIPYLSEPLRSFNLTFISEVKHGITTIDALENYKKKVDNNKFRLLIKNLQLCSKYSGSYVEVLKKSSIVLKDYSIEKDRRKSEVRKNRSTVFLMIAITLVIMFTLIKMNPGMLITLRRDIIGQLIITYNIIIILFSLYKVIIIEKFEF